MNKEALREDLLKTLSSLNSVKIQSLSLSLTHQIIKFFEKFPELTGQIGAGYLPFKSELAPMYQELFKTVPVLLSYPVIIEGRMEFAIPDGMPRGQIWLNEPYKQVDPEWLFVPGVGFGLDGSRLGRGKGFYDRYLAKKTKVTIGICWSEQIKESIPVEGHDCHMNYIITEQFCWDVKQQKKF